MSNIREKREKNFLVNKEISIAQFVAVAIAGVYISGYLINGLFLRNHGLVQLTTIDSLYIEIGLIFSLLTGITVVVPYITLKWAIKEKRESKLILNPYTFISPFVSTNYLFVLTFFSIFLTYYEWNNTIQLFGTYVSLKNTFAAYFLMWLLIGLVALLIIRKFTSQYRASSNKIFMWVLSFPFVLAFYYFTIIAYASGIYKSVPVSRGGRLPVTEANIELKKKINLTKELEDIVKSGVFVIEQDSTFLYVIPSNSKDWFKMTRHLYALRTDSIESINYSIILDGRPRVQQ